MLFYVQMRWNHEGRISLEEYARLAPSRALPPGLGASAVVELQQRYEELLAELDEGYLREQHDPVTAACQFHSPPTTKPCVATGAAVIPIKIASSDSCLM